jgi:uncharacterized protein
MNTHTSPSVPSTSNPSTANSFTSNPSASEHKSNFSRPLRRQSLPVVSAAIVSVITFALLNNQGHASAQSAQPPVSSSQPPALSNQGQPIRTVVVTGTGQVAATPDRMTLNLGIETRAPKVGDALKANNVAADKVIKLLREKGIADKDLQTSQLSIYPQFDSDGRRITAYQVTNSVTATIRKIDLSGEIVDAVSAVGGDAIRINGLAFSASDPIPSLAAARDLAVKDAKAQAEQLAKSAGVNLGKLRTIYNGSESRPLAQTEFRSVADASTPIAPGTQDITATVELVFDIVD